MYSMTNEEVAEHIVDAPGDHGLIYWLILKALNDKDAEITKAVKDQQYHLELGRLLDTIDKKDIHFEVYSGLEYEEDACEQCGRRSARKGLDYYAYRSEGGGLIRYAGFEKTLLEMLRDFVKNIEEE